MLWEPKIVEKNKFQGGGHSEDIIQTVRIKVKNQQYF